ncbi:hypothetical protein GJAV_G00102720, partial [Gymnothorax javanicus]
EGSDSGQEAESEEHEDSQIEVEIDSQLDRELESKSRQHNLTSANVRSIIHEVITNEHVVAMMKAAINETEAIPVFEPKMTRSKLKEVVEKGVVIPTWNISPMKKPTELKAPQFVDIPLEEEDSSDEEYRPDEDEEDETAEETLLESDIESTASSPRGSRGALARMVAEGDEDKSCSPIQRSHKSRHLRVVAAPMGPPPPPGPQRPPRAPPECSFMEKLHAVEEELAISPICLEPYQALSSTGEGSSLMACRTRSKRPLRDVPLGRLEAELQAPDITPDMYDCGSAPEDRDWTEWLRGLMTSDVENDEEGDDDDDPEYNFLADIDEPDVEDYRNDRAVRITKKEVSDLMEELFETFQDELLVQGQDEEGPEEEEEKEEEVPPQEASSFSIPQTVRFEDPPSTAPMERHRTVRQQLEAMRRRRAELESQAGGPVLLGRACALILTPAQTLQLQQQIQQHVQLLTQAHMLTSPVEALQSEAITSRVFLVSHDTPPLSEPRTQTALSHQPFGRAGHLHLSCSPLLSEGSGHGAMDPGFTSIFRASNLQGALSVLEEISRSPAIHIPEHCNTDIDTERGRSFPLLPPQLAWLMATRPAFMYPELLPLCSLDPALHPPRTNTFYTPGEDNLVVLGLRNFSETWSPYDLVCQYLIRTKGPKHLRKHVLDMCHRRPRNNVIKFFMEQRRVPPMPSVCREVKPGEERPPVEREEEVMPLWLRKSVRHIHEAVMDYNDVRSDTPCPPKAAKNSYTFPPNTRYPPTVPAILALHPSGFKRQRLASVLASCNTDVEELKSSRQITLCSHGGIIAGDGEKCGPLCETLSKMVPIQPAPPKPPLQLPQLLPVLSVPVGGAIGVKEAGAEAVTVVSGGTVDLAESVAVSDGVLPAVVINMAAPVVCAAPANAGSASLRSEAVPLPQGGVLSHPVATRQGKFGRPLLPAPPGNDPTKISPSETSVKMEPNSPAKPGFSGKLPKPEAPKMVVNIPPAPNTEANGDFLSDTADPKLGLLQNQTPSSTVAALPSPTGGAVYFLLNGASSGAPQFLFLPQNCAIANGAFVQVSAALEATNGLGETLECSMATFSGGLPASLKTDTCEVKCFQKEEKCTTEEEELEVVGDFGGHLLALSESSGSPAPSPCALEKVEEEEEDEKGGVRSRWGGLMTSTPQHSPEGEELKRGDIICWEGEEEVKSPGSVQSELSVPELQETMEKLTMLASEGIECEEGDSDNNDDDDSPVTLIAPPSFPNPQNSECEGEGLGEGGASQSAAGANGGPSGEEEAGDGGGDSCHLHASVTCRGSQELRGQDTEPLLTGDQDDDPLRESKDLALARAYLRRVCEAVRDVPGKVEEFLRVLYEFEQGGEEQSLVELFEQLKMVLREWPDLLWDFAAFLRPEQALECGLLAEQQAFERSRHFLRQLEMSFGESPAHYCQIVRALQEGPSLSPARLSELKSQVASLLKHDTRLQAEFWEFFEELHSSSPSVHPDDKPSSEVEDKKMNKRKPRGGVRGRPKLKERLPVSQEEEESYKSGPVMNRRGRKNNNLGGRNTSKGPVTRATKCRDLISSPTAPRQQKKVEEREGERRVSCQELNGPYPAEDSEEEGEGKAVGRGGQQERGEVRAGGDAQVNSPATHGTPASPAHPVCAKNVSLTSTGQRVVLWTREADRIILTTCKLKGANRRTFQAVSVQLGNKTANEVSLRFQELMALFHRAARANSKTGNMDRVSGSDDDPD